jgi:segregation and condensation protein B
MVRIAGRGSELGNPYLYGTTRRFLEVFGLAGLDALPRAARLRGTGLPAPSDRRGEAESVPADRADAPDATPLDELPASSQNSASVHPDESAD